MQINLTDEQILQIAEKQILQLVKPKVEKVLKDRYWTSQNMYEEINRAIHSVIEKRVNEIVDDESLKRMVKKENISKIIADNLIRTVSEDIVENVNKMFY